MPDSRETRKPRRPLRAPRPAQPRLAETKARRQSGQNPLLAAGLSILGEVYGRSGNYEAGRKTAEQAVEAFDAVGDFSGSGRAHWTIALAWHQLGRIKESHAAA